MRHLKRFNEELTNVSKIRKWPTYDGRNDADYYFVYKLTKNELGKYLNVWFQGHHVDKMIPGNRKRPKERHSYYDEIITLKKTDEKTSNHLYRRNYNPISINIMPSYKGELYDMKAHIHSIDDSYYVIWWNNMPLEEEKEARTKLMDWVSKQEEINGDEFLNICVSLGADENTKNYN